MQQAEVRQVARTAFQTHLRAGTNDDVPGLAMPVRLLVVQHGLFHQPDLGTHGVANRIRRGEQAMCPHRGLGTGSRVSVNAMSCTPKRSNSPRQRWIGCATTTPAATTIYATMPSAEASAWTRTPGSDCTLASVWP